MIAHHVGVLDHRIDHLGEVIHAVLCEGNPLLHNWRVLTNRQHYATVRDQSLYQNVHLTRPKHTSSSRTVTEQTGGQGRTETRELAEAEPPNDRKV